MKWIVSAKYADGTEIEKSYPYREGGIYSKEEQRQYELECWILEQHEDCIWYSVSLAPLEEG